MVKVSCWPCLPRTEILSFWRVSLINVTIISKPLMKFLAAETVLPGPLGGILPYVFHFWEGPVSIRDSKSLDILSLLRKCCSFVRQFYILTLLHIWLEIRIENTFIQDFNLWSEFSESSSICLLTLMPCSLKYRVKLAASQFKQFFIVWIVSADFKPVYIYN